MPTAQNYQRVMAALACGGPEQWEAIAAELPGFPDGVDDFIHRRWIVNALGAGSAAAVHWMVQKGIDLDPAASRRRSSEPQGHQRLDAGPHGCRPG
jgi:hypothetical protein